MVWCSQTNCLPVFVAFACSKYEKNYEQNKTIRLQKWSARFTRSIPVQYRIMFNICPVIYVHFYVSRHRIYIHRLDLFENLSNFKQFFHFSFYLLIVTNIEC